LASLHTPLWHGLGAKEGLRSPGIGSSASLRLVTSPWIGSLTASSLASASNRAIRTEPGIQVVEPRLPGLVLPKQRIGRMLLERPGSGRFIACPHPSTSPRRDRRARQHRRDRATDLDAQAGHRMADAGAVAATGVSARAWIPCLVVQQPSAPHDARWQNSR